MKIKENNPKKQVQSKTPKSLTGTEKMNKTTKESLEQLAAIIEREVRLESIEEVRTSIFDVIKRYENVLDSQTSEDIYYNSYGPRFERIQELRRTLRSKVFLLYGIAGMLYDLQQQK